MPDKEKRVLGATTEEWAASSRQTMVKEERSKTVYRLKTVGCGHSDAMEIALADCDRNQAVEMFKEGKTKDEIIKVFGVQQP